MFSRPAVKYSTAAAISRRKIGASGSTSTTYAGLRGPPQRYALAAREAADATLVCSAGSHRSLQRRHESRTDHRACARSAGCDCRSACTGSGPSSWAYVWHEGWSFMLSRFSAYPIPNGFPIERIPRSPPSLASGGRIPLIGDENPDLMPGDRQGLTGHDML